MSRALTLSAIALLAATAMAGCDMVKSDDADKAGNQSAAAGPPPPPPYQMRAQMPAGDRLKSTADGEALFSNRCGACHLAFGMGTNVLTPQQIAAGKPPAAGLLANRDDLTADYVIAVARNGKGAMPRQTRVDVTDAELAAIGKYLGKGK